jgi:hypothetical protein
MAELSLALHIHRKLLVIDVEVVIEICNVKLCQDNHRIEKHCCTINGITMWF